MFPTLVHDNRRKGRSSGPLVDSSITLPKVDLNTSKEKATARREEKALWAIENEKFEESIRKEAMVLAIESVKSGKS